MATGTMQVVKRCKMMEKACFVKDRGLILDHFAKVPGATPAAQRRAEGSRGATLYPGPGVCRVEALLCSVVALCC